MAFPDYSSAWTEIDKFDPSVYTKPVDLGVSYAAPTTGTPTPAQPFDWIGAGKAVGGFLGGVGNLIRGIRGQDPVPMAGYGLNTYLDRADNNDAFLKELLAIVARNKGDDFVLAGSRTPSPSKKWPSNERTPPINGVIVN